jgi:ubiquitin-protein ligase
MSSFAHQIPSATSAPSSATLMRSSRLMKEWLEIQKCPVANASVSPVNDENLNEWHGNIQGTENSEWEGIVVHFLITFPPEYPILPPRVRLFSYIPHLNVQSRNGCWEVCLDMFESQPIGSVTTPYHYWSSAFSVRSILVQMTSFLLADGQPTQVHSFPTFSSPFHHHFLTFQLDCNGEHQSNKK